MRRPAFQAGQGATGILLRIGDETLEHPLGENGERLHEWAFAAVSWRQSHGLSGGESNADSDVIPHTTLISSARMTTVRPQIGSLE